MFFYTNLNHHHHCHRRRHLLVLNEVAPQKRSGGSPELTASVRKGDGSSGQEGFCKLHFMNRASLPRLGGTAHITHVLIISQVDY